MSGVVLYRILPYRLWIGHAGDGREFREVFENGIRTIVQLAIEEPALQPPREIIFLRFPLLDGQGNDADLLNLAIKSVATLIEKKIPTLVCCGAGMSRSPGIVAAALSVCGRGTLEECVKQVVKSHSADVSPGLWDAIRQIIDKGAQENK